MSEIQLTYEQKQWLLIHGNRHEKDVAQDPDGRLFVLMYSPTALNKMEKIYLPPK